MPTRQNFITKPVSVVDLTPFAMRSQLQPLAFDLHAGPQSLFPAPVLVAAVGRRQFGQRHVAQPLDRFLDLLVADLDVWSRIPGRPGVRRRLRRRRNHLEKKPAQRYTTQKYTPSRPVAIAAPAARMFGSLVKQADTPDGEYELDQPTPSWVPGEKDPGGW